LQRKKKLRKKKLRKKNQEIEEDDNEMDNIVDPLQVVEKFLGTRKLKRGVVS